MTFSITNQTKSELPSWPYEAMKNSVLGPDYELSLVIIGENEIRALNHTHRGKDTPTDILSFPLDEKSGEMFIAPISTKKEAKKFDRPYDNFVAFLFIHGLWHLKGFDHSSTMESNEQKTRTRFGI